MWLDAMLIVAAYLLGSVPFAIVVSKAMKMGDPRDYGSGNPGATNVMRTGNKTAAALTFLGDFLKGFLATLLGLWLCDSNPEWLHAPQIQVETVALMAVAVVAGHMWPVFFGFKGGKGVATAAGAFFAFSWPLALTGLFVWALFKFALGMGGFEMLPAALAAVLGSLFFVPETTFRWAIAVIALLVLWRHKPNLIAYARKNRESIQAFMDQNVFGDAPPSGAASPADAQADFFDKTLRRPRSASKATAPSDPAVNPRLDDPKAVGAAATEARALRRAEKRAEREGKTGGKDGSGKKEDADSEGDPARSGGAAGRPAESEGASATEAEGAGAAAANRSAGDEAVEEIVEKAKEIAERAESRLASFEAKHADYLDAEADDKTADEKKAARTASDAIGAAREGLRADLDGAARRARELIDHASGSGALAPEDARKIAEPALEIVSRRADAAKALASGLRQEAKAQEKRRKRLKRPRQADAVLERLDEVEDRLLDELDRAKSEAREAIAQARLDGALSKFEAKTAKDKARKTASEAKKAMESALGFVRARAMAMGADDPAGAEAQLAELTGRIERAQSEAEARAQSLRDMAARPWGEKKRAGCADEPETASEAADWARRMEARLDEDFERWAGDMNALAQEAADRGGDEGLKEVWRKRIEEARQRKTEGARSLLAALDAELKGNSDMANEGWDKFKGKMNRFASGLKSDWDKLKKDLASSAEGGALGAKSSEELGLTGEAKELYDAFEAKAEGLADDVKKAVERCDGQAKRKIEQIKASEPERVEKAKAELEKLRDYGQEVEGKLRDFNDKAAAAARGSAESVKETFEKLSSELSDFGDAAKKNVQGMTDDAESWLDEMARKGAEAARSAKDNVSKAWGKVKDKTSDLADEISDKFDGARDSAKEAAQDAREKVGDSLDKAGKKLDEAKDFVKKDWEETKGDAQAAKESIDRAVDGVDAKLKKAKEDLSDKAEAAKDKAEELKGKLEDRAEAAKDKAEELKGKLESEAEEAKDKAEDLKDKMKDKAEEAKDKAEDFKDKMKDLAEEAKDKVEDLKDKMKDLAEEAKDKVEDLKDKMKDKAEDAGDKAEDFKDKMKDMAEESKDKAEEAKDKLSDKLDDAKKKVEDAVGDAKEFVKKDWEQTKKDAKSFKRSDD